MAVIRLGAVVLCGGRSRRMGTPKEWLPIGGEAFLQRVVGRIASRAGLVVVSAAEAQRLPGLPAGVEVVRDPRPDRGPLQGMAAAMGALAGRVEWAFACAADAPLLVPAWIDALLDRAEPGVDLVLPRVGGRDQPLAALYRPEVAAPAAEALLASGQSRLGLLGASLRARLADEEALAAVDPGFLTLRNINEPGDYEALLRLDPTPADAATPRGRSGPGGP